MTTDKQPNPGGDVHYSGNGEGKWFKSVGALRCTEDVFMTGQCQGVKGHEGVHWAYSPAGWFCWSANDVDLKPHQIAAGQTPPGHNNYRHPEDMQPLCYRCHHTQEEVIDPEKLAQLNAGEMEEGDSICQPVNMDDYPEDEKFSVDDVMSVIKGFNELQEELADTGANDTEPDFIYHGKLLDMLKDRGVETDLSANEWNLYAVEASDTAADKLSGHLGIVDLYISLCKDADKAVLEQRVKNYCWRYNTGG